MKIKLKPDSQVIEWKDGATITATRITDKKRSDVLTHCEKNGITHQEVMTDIMVENAITGWSDIIDDETGKPVEFNDSNRHQIFTAIKQDHEMLMRFMTFFIGPLGNSKAGLTSTLITDGALNNAPIASAETKKKASHASGKQGENANL